MYDTPPNLDHTATATAVREADIVLVVTSPSPADIWEAEDAVKFAKRKNDRESGGVVTTAATRLGLHRTTLNAIMRKLGITRSDL